MKINKATKLNPEQYLLRTLRVCTKILAQHPHLHHNKEVTSAINSLSKSNKHSRNRKQRLLVQPNAKDTQITNSPCERKVKHVPASRKRGRTDPTYRSVFLKRLRRAPEHGKPVNFQGSVSCDATPHDGTDGTAPAESEIVSSPAGGCSKNTGTETSQENISNAAMDFIRTPHEISRDLPTTSQETTLQKSSPYAVTNLFQEIPREISCDPATHSLQEPHHRTSHEVSETDQDLSYDFSITIHEAINIIRKFSKPLHETPQHIHIEIVRFFRKGVEMQQSDDRIWKNIIKTSFFKIQKQKVFTLLEYLGATCWFDKQVSILQQSSWTKRGQPIEFSTASGRVLDKLWREHNMDSENILGKMRKAERGRIWTHIHRVRGLRNQIIEQLGLGVLFFPNIWDFMGLSSEKRDIAIKVILAKSKQKTVLQLLEEQVEYLVKTGSTDPYTFFTGLKEDALVQEQEFEDLLADMQVDRVNGAETQVQDLATLPTGSQRGPSLINHDFTTQNQLLEVAEPSFNVFKDDDTSSVIGFEFENVMITSKDISDVKDNASTFQENIMASQENDPNVSRDIHWLSISHIRLFCLYLRVNLSRGCHPSKIYFFCPLTVSKFKEGWQLILEAEGPQSDKNHIPSAHYLVFPLLTDEIDHWFTVIISRQDELSNVKTPAAYILDSRWYEWKTKLQRPIEEIITKAMSGLTAADSGMVQFYEAAEGTLPQQSEELCGYYLMLYLELLATDPNALLTRIRKFNTAKTRMDHLFKPGKMDREVAERFAGLIEEFQYLEQREGRLVTKSGQPMFEGDLRCLARGMNLVEHVPEQGGEKA
ncbi:hypothetical protein BDV12DRAFT_181674 [Aspergillus spectabilis]